MKATVTQQKHPQKRNKTSWVKGQSGNPKGWAVNLTTPKEVIEAAKQHGPKAIETLADLMGEEHPASVRLHAADTILSRAYGKPKETVEVEHKTTLVALLAAMAERGDGGSSAPMIDVTPEKEGAA